MSRGTQAAPLKRQAQGAPEERPRGCEAPLRDPSARPGTGAAWWMLVDLGIPAASRSVRSPKALTGPCGTAGATSTRSPNRCGSAESRGPAETGREGEHWPSSAPREQRDSSQPPTALLAARGRPPSFPLRIHGSLHSRLWPSSQFILPPVGLRIIPMVRNIRPCTRRLYTVPLSLSSAPSPASLTAPLYGLTLSHMHTCAWS